MCEVVQGSSVPRAGVGSCSFCDGHKPQRDLDAAHHCFLPFLRTVTGRQIDLLRASLNALALLDTCTVDRRRRILVGLLRNVARSLGLQDGQTQWTYAAVASS